MLFPKLTGIISITDESGKVSIAGDNAGLKSLANLLTWLADADLDGWPYLKEGQNAHIHIYPRVDISENSREVELVRLDKKMNESTMR